jgi:hypothetical protein
MLFFIINHSPILGSIHSKTTSADYDVLCGFLIKSEKKMFYFAEHLIDPYIMFLQNPACIFKHQN